MRGAELFLPLILLAANAAAPASADHRAEPSAPQPAANSAPFALRPGEHIAILGNTLADRMQHDGWFETMIHGCFPRHRLVIRNLGFSGDELAVRLRSEGFGTPDQWLARCKADVVFAFFGYNESYADTPGLERFRADLRNFLRETGSSKPNGVSNPRIVLFSPIAFENLHSRHLPDGVEHNRRLELYTRAMVEVAGEAGVRFVDLFTPTLAAYPKAPPTWTINGVHLTPEGNRRLAAIVQQSLFANDAFDLRDPDAETIRQAVLDKNFHWFNRYRTVDGYSIFGGRADLKFVDGQTNRVVMDREMEILDLMTANRDRRIWETVLAMQEGNPPPADPVDDSNLPPFIPVQTNKPGPLTGGKHRFLTGEEAISRMKLADHLQVNLFASEETFPQLVNPVQMQWDPKGRLWVAVWPTYPHWKPKSPMNDKLLILEDVDGDGKADKCTVFADGLHCPTGFEFFNGGVLIAQAPDLLLLRDLDGDGKADVRERVLHGLDSADTHHTANSFTFDPAGGLYFQEGTFHHTQVETPHGPPVRVANAGVFRYEPRTQRFEAYVSFGFANPHGHVFDAWGRDIVVDGTGSNPFDAALFSGRMIFPDKHRRPPQVYQQWTRPCPGIEILSSRHFPEEMQGNLLVANVIGFQGILQYRLREQGASIVGEEADRLLSSDDANFRPTDLKIGPDGALWFIDWQNPIIGHMQHNLRDPSRDVDHGRVYRVTWKGRQLLQPTPIAGQPIAVLLEALDSPEDRVKYRARMELAARDSDTVIAETRKWLASMPANRKDRERLTLEGLWLLQSHDAVDEELLDRLLNSPDHRARAAAARCLCRFRDRIADPLGRFRKLALDNHPRVRLEAARAASFFDVPEAIEIVWLVSSKPTDQYIDFVVAETLRTIEPIFRTAVNAGRTPAFATDIGRRNLLRNLPNDRLLTVGSSRETNFELLFRAGIADDRRRRALRELAREDGKAEAATLLEAIGKIDDETEKRDSSVVYDLIRLLKELGGAGGSGEGLAAARGEIERLAFHARQPAIRHAAWVALIDVDKSADAVWKSASASTDSLVDLLDSVRWIPDTTVRASLFARIAELLSTNAGRPSAPVRTAPVRFIRIELPGKRRTLTLAEVEVRANGRNIAPAGKATQSSTAFAADASRAIDGNASPRFADNGQTHTRENEANPWWELDLQTEFAIDAIEIVNRQEEDLGRRLEGFSVKALDRDRKVMFERTGLPAPTPRARIVVQPEDPRRKVRRAAMAALADIPGRESDAYRLLARLLSNAEDHQDAMAVLTRIPVAAWDRESAAGLLESVLASIRAVPPAARNSPESLTAFDLAHSLAGLLPADRARKVRTELANLGVTAIRLGTLPERMAYDKERIIVAKGRQVEFIFANSDLMPHNFAIVLPGSLEEIGTAAEATATQPDAASRHFIPKSPKVLLASRLLQPGESQRLAFATPSKPGVYPYVCTYPGHWRRMFGALYVVDDPDECLADFEGYVQRHKLMPADELLKDIRARTEWRFEDLAGAVEQMKSGRSFDSAKRAFRLANCIACHKLDNAGNAFGPELEKLDPKITATEILKNVLEPSAKIDEKYASWILTLDDGRVVTGLILEETPTEVKLIENPLASPAATTIAKSAIEARRKSDTSLMPKGLLDRLSKEEALDLIAFIAARGDRRSPLFSGGESGHHH